MPNPIPWTIKSNKMNSGMPYYILVSRSASAPTTKPALTAVARPATGSAPIRIAPTTSVVSTRLVMTGAERIKEAKRSFVYMEPPKTKLNIEPPKTKLVTTNILRKRVIKPKNTKPVRGMVAKKPAVGAKVPIPMMVTTSAKSAKATKSESAKASAKNPVVASTTNTVMVTASKTVMALAPKSVIALAPKPDMALAPIPVMAMAAKPVKTMANMATKPVMEMAAKPVYAMVANPIKTMATKPVTTMATVAAKSAMEMAAKPVYAMVAKPVKTMATKPVTTMATVAAKPAMEMAAKPVMTSASKPDIASTPKLVTVMAKKPVKAMVAKPVKAMAAKSISENAAKDLKIIAEDPPVISTALKDNITLVYGECRLCLQMKWLGLNNIFKNCSLSFTPADTTIAKELNNLAQVEISETDGHSQEICKECLKKFLLAVKFIHDIRKVETTLNNRKSTTTSFLPSVPLLNNKKGTTNTFEKKSNKQRAVRNYEPVSQALVKTEPESVDISVQEIVEEESEILIKLQVGSECKAETLKLSQSSIDTQEISSLSGKNITLTEDSTPNPSINKSALNNVALCSLAKAKEDKMTMSVFSKHSNSNFMVDNKPQDEITTKTEYIMNGDVKALAIAVNKEIELLLQNELDIDAQEVLEQQTMALGKKTNIGVVKDKTTTTCSKDTMSEMKNKTEGNTTALTTAVQDETVLLMENDEQEVVDQVNTDHMPSRNDHYFIDQNKSASTLHLRPNKRKGTKYFEPVLDKRSCPQTDRSMFCNEDIDDWAIPETLKPSPPEHGDTR